MFYASSYSSYVRLKDTYGQKFSLFQLNVIDFPSCLLTLVIQGDNYHSNKVPSDDNRLHFFKSIRLLNYVSIFKF